MQTVGGFFIENVKNGIVNDCLRSGNAEMYYLAITEALLQLDDDIDNEFNGNIYAFFKKIKEGWQRG